MINIHFWGGLLHPQANPPGTGTPGVWPSKAADLSTDVQLGEERSKRQTSVVQDSLAVLKPPMMGDLFGYFMYFYSLEVLEEIYLYPIGY